MVIAFVPRNGTFVSGFLNIKGKKHTLFIFPHQPGRARPSKPRLPRAQQREGEAESDKPMLCLTAIERVQKVCTSTMMGQPYILSCSSQCFASLEELEHEESCYRGLAMALAKEVGAVMISCGGLSQSHIDLLRMSLCDAHQIVTFILSSLCRIQLSFCLPKGAQAMTAAAATIMPSFHRS